MNQPEAAALTAPCESGPGGWWQGLPLAKALHLAFNELGGLPRQDTGGGL